MGQISIEPTGYFKGAWSDLQGAWCNLRHELVERMTFPEAPLLLFHIDEGMSWESVREPENMRRALDLVQKIAGRADAPAEVMDWIGVVREDFGVVMEAIQAGRAK